MRSWLRRSLVDVVPRDQRDSPSALRRRRLVTAAFVVLGAIVLGLSLRIEPGSPLFYVGTLGLAAIWAVGAFVSGPLHLGRSSPRSPSGWDWPASSSPAGSWSVRSTGSNAR